MAKTRYQKEVAALAKKDAERGKKDSKWVKLDAEEQIQENQAKLAEIRSDQLAILQHGDEGTQADGAALARLSNEGTKIVEMLHEMERRLKNSPKPPTKVNPYKPEALKEALDAARKPEQAKPISVIPKAGPPFVPDPTWDHSEDTIYCDREQPAASSKAVKKVAEPTEVYATPAVEVVVDDWEMLEDFEAHAAMAVDKAYAAFQSATRSEVTEAFALEVVDSAFGNVQAAATAAIAKVDITGVDAIKEANKRTHNVLMGFRDGLTKQEAYWHNAEAWEKYLPNNPGDDITLPPAKVQQELLKGVPLTYQFDTAKPDMEQKHSHVILNTSRVVTSAMVLMKAAKFARVSKAAQPTKAVAVVDVGSGYNGVKDLELIARNRQNAAAGLFYHAMMPMADTSDQHRIGRLRATDLYADMNYLPETMRLVPGRISYCHHKAHECDCLKYFDIVKAVANHAAYYFRQADYDNLFKYTDAIDCTIHMPKIGETIPAEAPEYEWKKGSESGSWLQRTASKFRERWTGIPEVVMSPMKNGETTYRHMDVGFLVEKGGMHVSAQSSRFEGIACDMGKLKEYAAAVACGGTPSVVMTTMLAGPLCGAVAAGAYVLGAAACTDVMARLACHRRFNVEAPWEATATYRFRVVSSYGETGKEELSHVMRVTKEAPSELVRGLRESAQVAPEELPRATAALALAGVTPKTQMHVAATLVRDRVPIVQVKHTVKHATRLVNYLAESLTDPPLLPSEPKSVLGSIFLLPALVCAQKLSSLTTASLRQRGTAYAATALLPVINSPLIPLTCFILWLGPLMWAASWVALRLWGLAVRD